MEVSFAQIDALESLKGADPSSSLGGPLQEIGIILLCVAVLAALLLAWVIFSHKRRRRGIHRGKKVSGTSANPSAEQEKKRRRRKKDVRRSPTLAETGGLPPRRPDPPDMPSPD